ncbi:MAG: sigma-70 family RNA polymerase sigma factor [Alphaproteobacteria bacterium]|nr:sigma-70 family RNA polymerase sigma factor [Alphaproteobacteria bacterium]
MMPATAPASDADLVLAFQNGDDSAFAELYARWRPRATAYAVRMVGSPEEAEELVTEAFVTLVEGRFAPTGSFRSYLFTVLQRKCLDHLRRRGTRGKVLPLLAPEPVEPDLEGAIDGFRDRRRVEAALQSLPDEHRSVVLLYYAHGLASREVAEATGLSDQQVRSKLSYARKTLKTLLEREDP